MLLGTAELSKVKKTSQNAPLERLLNWLRTTRIKKYIEGKEILDFGCGEKYFTLRSNEHIFAKAVGFDLVFEGNPLIKVSEKISLAGDLSDVTSKVERIVALACFEHIYPQDLPGILASLSQISTPDAMIIGTVPRPLAKPVLEFLSYRLRLIDPSQIRDHKIYYDRPMLEKVIEPTQWRLEKYETFQFTMNSFFILKKV